MSMPPMHDRYDSYENVLYVFSGRISHLIGLHVIKKVIRYALNTISSTVFRIS